VQHQLEQKTPPLLVKKPILWRAWVTPGRRNARKAVGPLNSVGLRYVLTPREIVLCDQGPKAKVTRARTIVRAVYGMPDTIRIDRLRAFS
jgi:hypothetical protein